MSYLLQMSDRVFRIRFRRLTRDQYEKIKHLPHYMVKRIALKCSRVYGAMVLDNDTYNDYLVIIKQCWEKRNL